MKTFLSAVPFDKASVLCKPMLLVMACVSFLIASESAIAADATSEKSASHSVTVTVDSSGKVDISGDKDTKSQSDKSHGASDSDADNDDGKDDGHDDNFHHGHAGDVVQVFGDATLDAGDTTRDLVAVMGVSTNNGDVTHDVVSVFGSTHVNGTVGHDAVAVMGANYINGKVGHDVVAVMGNLELGPQAEVGNDVVVIGGSLKRDPSAIVHGQVNKVGPNLHLGNFDWLRSWLDNCLFKARLLAFNADVAWAWWVALIALLAYVLTALLFPRAVNRCVDVMEDRPGHVVLASLLAIVGIPVLMILLIITIIGIIAVPLVGIGLMLAGILGKVVILAWIGRRIVKKPESGAFSHPIIAVLVGGLLVLMLYTVPVLSLIVYKVIGFLGLGVVVYTLLLEIRSRGDKAGPSGSSGQGAQQTNPSSADLADHGDAAPAGATPNVNQTQAAADLSSTQTIGGALTELPRAGFWVRMLALFLDLILVMFVTHILTPKWIDLDAGATFTVLAIYGAVMWKLKGATIGDILFKLQVVRADGRDIDWTTAIVRSLGCFLSFIVAGLGFFWIAFDENKQAWHDKIAGTLVVQNPKGISLV